jgi:hypothetical protein
MGGVLRRPGLSEQNARWTVKMWTKSAACVLLACCVAGCGGKRLPESAYEDTKREQAEKIAAAKKAYSAFVEEVGNGIKLLEARPWTDATDAMRRLKEQNDRMHEKLRDAKSKGLSELKKFRELQMDGDNVMRFFNGPVETTDYQLKERKDSPAERQVALINTACDKNLGAIHKTLDLMKAKIEGTADDTKKADGKK